MEEISFNSNRKKPGIESRLHKWLSFTLTAVLTIGVMQLRCRCDVTEPEVKTGSLHIQASGTVTRTAEIEAVSQVHCFVSREDQEVHEDEHLKTGSRFFIVIEDLEPAEDYSVLLLGQNEDGQSISRGYQDSIHVIAGEQTDISIPWDRFQPALVLPEDGSTIGGSMPEFEWSSVSGAGSYTLQVDDSDDFSGPVVDESGLSATGYTPSDALNDGLYCWRVRGCDDFGNPGEWSNVWTFTIDTQGPSAPNLLAPKHGSATGDNRPLFEWSSVSGAGSYTLQVDDSDDFSGPVVDESGLSATGYTPSDALNDGLYCWRVRGCDDFGNPGEWSNVWTFTIDTQGPSAPDLIAPADGATLIVGMPVFEWSSVSDADVYEFQVTASENFACLLINETDLSSTNYTSSGSLENGVYYWRVRAYDSCANQGVWSDTWTFTINAPHTVNTPLIPMGPSTGETGQSLSFSTGHSSCSRGHTVQYRFSWGDSKRSPWGSSTQIHHYASAGTFSIKAQARCATDTDIVSGWVSGKSVVITGFETGTMTGNDGKTYATIQIGGKWWTAENLRETKYRNGDEIPVVYKNEDWCELTAGARTVYDNDENYADLFGYLYNWYAVDDSRKLAPSGWRVATDADWIELEMYFGMSQSDAERSGNRGTNQGSKLAGRASLWRAGELKNHDAFGTSGFSALAGGYRSSHYCGGTFNGRTYYEVFWTSTGDGSEDAWLRHIGYDSPKIVRFPYHKRYGYAIRLVREY